MKLRNKKTGEVIDLDTASIKAQYGGMSIIPLPMKPGGDEYVYYSLEGLVDEWEDYVPEKPFIKDKKIREIIRSWAKVNGATELKYNVDENSLRDIFRNEIHFNHVLDLEDGITYTTEELCGTPEPIEPTFVDLDERAKEKGKKPRPVIVNGVEYDSYADYLKSREEEE